MAFIYSDLIPKTFVCLKEGYNKKTFFSDLFAGMSVGVIALPLSLAFAIASGLTPEKGLFTAIIAGFLISLLGGSRVQIGGPAGAFVVIVYGIVQEFGYDGLLIATMLAAVMLIIMGLARFGVLLKFIPYPVTTGFTTGIAITILVSQIKDFFGLEIDKVPPQFVEKCNLFCQMAHTFNFSALGVAVGTLLLIVVLRRVMPKFPGAIFAVVIATLVVLLFQLPVETIQSKFGSIPRLPPLPSLPEFSLEKIKAVFPSAITLALLGAIESLLCAVVADGMTGQRHRPNCELIAQGVANMGACIFGGMPATGTIARTSANIRLGARTPFAGMIHSITLLLIIVAFAPLAAMIPLAALAGVLVFVAWNMMELSHFVEIMRGHKGDALVLLTTFFLTILIDLSVAVQIGVLMAAVIFLKRMTDKTTVQICQELVKENRDETPEHSAPAVKIPSDVVVFEINGPFFYSVADLLDEALRRLDKQPRTFILRVDKMPLIDATGLYALKKFAGKCKAHDIHFLVTGVTPHLLEQFNQANVTKAIGRENISR